MANITILNKIPEKTINGKKYTTRIQHNNVASPGQDIAVATQPIAVSESIYLWATLSGGSGTHEPFTICFNMEPKDTTGTTDKNSNVDIQFYISYDRYGKIVDYYCKLSNFNGNNFCVTLK